MIIEPYRWHTLRIESIETIAARTMSVRVTRPDGYEFTPGQYAVVRVGSHGEHALRQYSYASAPDDTMIEFIIQREPNGVASNWFFEIAKAGMELTISQAFGNFTLRDTNTNPAFLLAGRVGVAPFLSMLRSGAEVKQLIYSASKEEELCYRDELRAHGAKFAVTESDERLSAHSLSELIDSDGNFYLCGSKRFVDGVTDYLKTNKISPEKLHREPFTLQ